jgi:hypothetical protein
MNISEKDMVNELLNKINFKSNKTIGQMLIELGLYTKGENVTLAELMTRMQKCTPKR